MPEDKDRKHPDDPGGYGGGLRRAQETPDHAFGETAYSDGRGSGDAEREADTDGATASEMPEGVKDVGPDDPKWQERYVKENADKYGQAGGEPIVQRGPGQSAGGHDSKDASPGPTEDLSPRGGVGIRETEKWKP